LRVNRRAGRPCHIGISLKIRNRNSTMATHLECET
jgi:hypothetical protein